MHLRAEHNHKATIAESNELYKYIAEQRHCPNEMIAAQKFVLSCKDRSQVLECLKYSKGLMESACEFLDSRD